MKKFTGLALVLILAVAVLVAGCGANVVAVVNGESITQKEFDDRLAMVVANFEAQGLKFEGEQGKEFLAHIKDSTLEQMIDEVLLLQEGKNLGLEPTDKEITDEIKGFKESFGSEGEYRKFLAANGLSETKVMDLVRQQMIIDALIDHINQDAKDVEEAEIKAYYDENKEYFTRPEERRVRHILISSGDGSERSDIDAKVEAMKIVDRLKSGEDFTALVAEKSEDPGSIASGGEYTFSRGQGFVQEFEDAAFALAEGNFTSEPVRTRFGYHIIKLEEIIPARVQPFDEVRAEILASLTEREKGIQFEEYLTAQREKAEIKNNLVKNESEAAKD